MNESDDFARMSDPDFLAERKRIRETIEALQERYQRMTMEFDRRARAKWADGSDAA